MKIQHFALAIGIAVASVSATAQQAGAVQTQAQACGAAMKVVANAENDYRNLVNSNWGAYVIYQFTGIDLAGFGNALATIQAANDIAMLPCGD